MKQFILNTVAVLAMGAMAEAANTVKVTKFHQSYPYSGKATVEYMVGGALPAGAVAEITINTDNASATFTQRNIVTGANTFTIDFASFFGGALLLTNASFVVTITGDLGASSCGRTGRSRGTRDPTLWPLWCAFAKLLPHGQAKLCYNLRHANGRYFKGQDCRIRIGGQWPRVGDSCAEGAT